MLAPDGRSAVRARILSRLEAQVSATAGVDVSLVGGVYRVGLDISDFSTNNSPALTDRKVLTITDAGVHELVVANDLAVIEQAATVSAASVMELPASVGSIIINSTDGGTTSAGRHRRKAVSSEPSVPNGAKHQSADGRWWVIDETTLGPEMFLDRNGSFATEMQSITDMFSFASDGDSIQFKAGKTYTITQETTTTKDLRVFADGAKFIVTANVNAFTFTNSVAESVALSADYVDGETTIAVAALSSAMKAGEAFKLFSNATDPGDRDEGSNSAKYRVGEWATAGAGSTTTSIVLNRPLRFTRGISPVSASGDEAAVSAFTTSMNARVFRLTKKTMSWTGGTFEYEDGHDASWTARCLYVGGYVAPEIRGVSVIRGYGPAVTVNGCYCPIVDARVENLTDNPSNGQYGYGVVDASYGARVTIRHSANVRHAYTSGPATAADNETNEMRILGAGRVVGAYITGAARGGNASVVAPFDTHHASEDVSFVDCFVDGFAGPAFNIRGRGITIDRPVVRNCGAGFNIITEWASGSPDDDLGLNEKSKRAHTSCRVVNADVQCDGVILSATTAVVNMAGDGVYSSKANMLISSNGAEIIFSGSHVFTVSGAVTDASANVVSFTAAAAEWASWSTTQGLYVTDAASVTFDFSGATYGTGSRRLINVPAGIVVDMKGVVRALLSSSFTSLLSTTGTFTSKRGGEIVYSGVAGGFAQNATGRAVRVRNYDGSYLYDASRNAGDELVEARRPLGPILTHNGTGAFVEGVYIAPCEPAPLYTAGMVYEAVLHVAKTGSAGAATVRVRQSSGAGPFVLDVPLLAADRAVDIFIRVEVRSGTTQRVTARSVASDAAGGAAVTRSWHTDETLTMSSATAMLAFGVNAAVGDTIIFDTLDHRGTLVGS